ncbi:MAG: glutamine synthetase family protein [Elusimicrobia bacterium]|nr:glutamine synthetase family protein [Elusimicrobiota bacterium]
MIEGVLPWPALVDAPPASFDALSKLISSRGLKFAELWFTDLEGRPWRIMMPTDAVSEALFVEGLPLDGQPIGGSWDGVMRLLPRLDAAYVDSTASVASLVMFCDILEPGGVEPLALEPRHVLARAVDLAEKRFDGRIVVGVEPEFILLEADGRPAAENVVWDFLSRLALSLGDAGIRVDWFRSGPASGQGRAQMRAGPPLQMADRVMLYRHLAAGLARERGLTASFLPRPLAGGGTPGMPVHAAVWRRGENLFHDELGWALTSALCRSFAAGVLAHLPALTALCAPTTNSYRRLIPGHSGPVNPVLSTVDRSAACRIPSRTAAPGARRVKFCLPDSTANPYLALAAVILAGLDGVERGLEPSIDGERTAGAAVPPCLEAALESLAADRAFLTSGAFSDRLIDSWIMDRWTRHVLPVRLRPHPWEQAQTEQFGSARGVEDAPP